MGKQIIPCPQESAEQKALFQWAAHATRTRPELARLFAIPNGGSRHPIEAANLKAQGVKAGVPDMFLPVARGGYHGLWIELKRQRGGRASTEQLDWLAALTEQGYRASICNGWDEARRLIERYLDDEEARTG